MIRRRNPAPAPSHTEEQFQRLVREHAGSMYRVAFAVVRDSHLAEDVVQEAVVKAWQNLDSFRADGSMKSWLSSISHNTAVSFLRRARDTAVDPQQLPERASTDDLERNAEVQHDVAVLFSAIDALDPLSRSILVLRDVEGVSYADIAERLDLPLTTVKTRLLRARRTVSSTLLNGATP